MRFRFDHDDHHEARQHPGDEIVEVNSPEEAERDSLKLLCSNAAEAAKPHAAASLRIRDKAGKPLAIATVNATIKRL